MIGGPDRQPDYGGWRIAAQLSVVGLTLALSIAIGGYLGYLADQKLGTRWLVIVGTLIGVAAGFKQLIQAVREANREEERRESENPPDRKD